MLFRSDTKVIAQLSGQGAGQQIGGAAGGMHSWREALDMVEAGASRLGTSSTLAILEGADQ